MTINYKITGNRISAATLKGIFTQKFYDEKITTEKLFISVCNFASCGKDGDPGQKGESGEKGSTGQAGATGSDGSVMLSGTGIPDPSLGKIGDYYLNKSDATLYGPKNSTGWGPALVLKGNAGSAGKDGSKMLSAGGVPTISLGAEGDFYFDTQNLAMYGPKTATSWGNATSLKNNDNGVVTLLYKNQAFQSIVRDVSSDDFSNHQIAYHNQEIIEANATIAQYQQQYDKQVVQINVQTGYTPAQKATFIAQAKAQFDSNVTYPKQRIDDASKYLTYYNYIKSIGNFDMSSAYTLDIKYQNAYDNGLVMVQTKIVNTFAGWSSSGQRVDMPKVPFGPAGDVYAGYWVGYKDYDVNSNNKIVIDGSSEALDKATVDAIRFDVKITLINAGTVITMASKGLNVKDVQSVSKYLDENK